MSEATREVDEAKPAETKSNLSPAAQRALAEAEARRKAAAGQAQAQPQELGGRGGLDPARFGDWEVKGLASDF
ncbi:DUF1674 domain-containing protein [Methylocystis parvus]|uniref:DUF1674 domain-containing protein n=1 Tax=Methylocystis parvus TaxID=134 RepID=A0A6B8M2S3_9HYPH|nr:DUF1674 domain-containing protein [Methylocystis parvus]QGM98114.1 DUF1674 domain-containing protein [Methylocystis parvus]WBK01565.1 DUF1674 domain-containing protein [Methylocystis parvus OBBP]